MFAKHVRKHFPSLSQGVIAMDATIQPHEIQNNDRLISLPDEPLDTWRERAEGVPILSTDNYLPTLIMPIEMDLGAGATRCIGMIKGAPRFNDIESMLEKVLLKKLENVDGSGRTDVRIHIVSALCGGQGAPLAPYLGLIGKHVVYKNCPTARCTTVYHAALSSIYSPEVASPDIKRKLKANDFASLVELDYASKQEVVTNLCKQLNIAPLRGAAIDTLIPYHAVDESNRSYDVIETIRQRVVPNILSLGDEGYRIKHRERNSNQLAMNAAASGARPIVEMVQAGVAQVPAQLASTWAMHVALQKLRSCLASPTEERIAQLSTSLEENLKLVTDKNEIAAAYTKVRTSMALRPEGFRKLSASAVETELRAAFKRYISTTKAEIQGIQNTLLRHYKGEAIPERTKSQLAWLVGQGQSLPEVCESLSRLKKSLHKVWEKNKDQVSNLSTVVKKRQDVYLDALGSLRKRFVTGSTKVRAVEALNNLFEADLEYREAAILLSVIEGFIGRLGVLIADVAETHEEVSRQHDWAELELAKSKVLATGQSTNLTSVIGQDEIDKLLSHLTDAIPQIPDLDIEELVEGGNHEVFHVIDRYKRDLADRYRHHVETKYPDILSFVRACGLRFSVDAWLNDALKGLALPSPVSSGALGATPPQTVLVASGRDLAAAKALMTRSDKLSYIECVEGTTRRTLSVVRFVTGLTVKSVPTYAEGMRAASSYPKPGTTGIDAWLTLPSGELMLPAFQQAGLVAPEWAEKPTAKRSRIAATVAARNGNDDE
jgi:ferritin-like metal-binding protein YciE